MGGCAEVGAVAVAAVEGVAVPFVFALGYEGGVDFGFDGGGENGGAAAGEGFGAGFDEGAAGGEGAGDAVEVLGGFGVVVVLGGTVGVGDGFEETGFGEAVGRAEVLPGGGEGIAAGADDFGLGFAPAEEGFLVGFEDFGNEDGGGAGCAVCAFVEFAALLALGAGVLFEDEFGFAGAVAGDDGPGWMGAGGGVGPDGFDGFEDGFGGRRGIEEL